MLLATVRNLVRQRPPIRRMSRLLGFKKRTLVRVIPKRAPLMRVKHVSVYAMPGEIFEWPDGWDIALHRLDQAHHARLDQVFDRNVEQSFVVLPCDSLHHRHIKENTAPLR